MKINKNCLQQNLYAMPFKTLLIVKPLCASRKLTIRFGNRKIEFVVTGLTVALIVLTIWTYILDQQKSNWVCGPVLFVLELFAIGFQSILTVMTWKARNHRTKIILLFVSFLIVGLVIFGFVNFNLNCT